jgi:cytochrome b561
MNFLSPRQIARRALLSRRAVYHDDSTSPHAVKRSDLTRLLHLVLLVAIVHQLLNSEFMRRPLPGDPPSVLYVMHEYIGLTSFGVVLAFWVWTLARRGETRLDTLFPWLFPARMRAIFIAITSAAAELRDVELLERVGGILAGAVHGLGLLVATGMAVTGTVYYFEITTPLAHQALELHRLMANLMWAYLIGHGGVAVLHHLLGSDVLRRMFWIRRGRRVRARELADSER